MRITLKSIILNLCQFFADHETRIGRPWVGRGYASGRIRLSLAPKVGLGNILLGRASANPERGCLVCKQIEFAIDHENHIWITIHLDQLPRSCARPSKPFTSSRIAFCRPRNREWDAVCWSWIPPRQKTISFLAPEMGFKKKTCTVEHPQLPEIWVLGRQKRGFVTGQQNHIWVKVLSLAYCLHYALDPHQLSYLFTDPTFWSLIKRGWPADATCDKYFPKLVMEFKMPNPK